MTPEYKASLPSVENPTAKSWEEKVRRMRRIRLRFRAHRVIQNFRDFPRGHSDSQSRPQYVTDWEIQHGQAPESAERVLEELNL